MVDEGLPDAAEPTLAEVLGAEPGAAVVRLDDSETVVGVRKRRDTVWIHAAQRCRMYPVKLGKLDRLGGISDEGGKNKHSDGSVIAVCGIAMGGVHIGFTGWAEYGLCNIPELLKGFWNL